MRPTKEVMLDKGTPYVVDEWLWEHKNQVKARGSMLLPEKYPALVKHCLDLEEDLKFRLKKVQEYINELEEIRMEQPEYFI